MTKTDVLIIGAGPGGYRAAEYAAQQGLQVAIVEQDEVGGTCLNRGCIPTKTYVHSASFQEATERQQRVVGQLRSGVEGLLAQSGITLLRGRASFLDDHTVSVSGIETSQCGVSTVDTLTAPNIIIATGSTAKMLPIDDVNDPRVVTSTGLLQLQTLPRRLAIIGAGVIGMEFASVFHRFGSEVTVIEYMKECLPALDSDIAKRLRKLMEKRGISFRMKTSVQHFSDIDADVILVATGRQANTEGLNLQAAGIKTDARGFIVVDENFRCKTEVNSQLSTPNSQLPTLHAIGDVNGRQLLAHAAEMQAIRAVNHIVGKSDGIRFDIMPAAVFTEPEAACVGPTEDQLKAQYATSAGYRCRKAFWRANGKALAMNESEGMLKLFSTADDMIVGCHAYGAHAADIVQEVSVLMCRDTTVAQLRDMVHIHPTLGEILKSATES